MNIPFIKYSKIWLGISVLVVVLSLASVIGWGLKPGIDFTGGSLLEVGFSKTRPTIEALQTTLEKNNLKDSIVQKTGDNGFIIRTAFLSQDAHVKLVKDFETSFSAKDNTLTEIRFETIGPSVSSQLRQKAILAVVLVNISIILFLAYAFRKVSKPVASWKYGLLAIIALVHDICLVLGVFALLGHFYGVEVDLAFVVALLTVLGFSVNDTIVVYDRIRENLMRKTGSSFAEVVNNGLNQTLMRSINTTLTVLLPLFALYFFGGPTIRYFALALLIGMASGAYSSIFIASPLLVIAEKLSAKK